jgi:hypothetical protein
MTESVVPLKYRVRAPPVDGLVLAACEKYSCEPPEVWIWILLFAVEAANIPDRVT